MNRLRERMTAILLIALFMLSVFAVMCEAEEIDTTVEGIAEVIDILPVGKTFTYITDDFQINVSLPLNLGLSTSAYKEKQKLDIYFKPFRILSGLFKVDVETGVKVRLPLFGLFIFVDIDTTILYKNRPDHFRFEWPILGIPSQALSLESGDIGIYSIAIPIKVGEGDLESLSVGEWSHIASYDLYAVMESKLTAMGVETEDVTIGSVMELERIENELESELGELDELETELELETEVESLVDFYRNLYEDLQKRYNSLLLNFTRLQEDLDEANLEISSARSELDLVELELEEKRSELNKVYDKITIFQVVALVAFVAGLSLMYIMSKRGKVIP